MVIMGGFDARETLTMMLAALTLPACVVLLFELRERRARRRLDSAVFSVQFKPPTGLSPTEAGVLVDGKAHLRDVLATVFDLGNRGYVRIREMRSDGGTEDYELILLKSGFRDDAQLKPHESYILGLFFGVSQRTTVSEVIDSGILSAARSAIEKRVYGQMVATGYFRGSPVRKNSGHVRQIIGGLLMPVLLLALLPTLDASQPIILSFLFAVSILASVWICLTYLRIRYPITEAGLEARKQALGFREYLLRAEKYRIEWQINEQVFSEYMPYALAFDVLGRFLRACVGYADIVPEWFESSQQFRDVQRVARFVVGVGKLARAFGATLTELTGKNK